MSILCYYRTSCGVNMSLKSDSNEKNLVTIEDEFKKNKELKREDIEIIKKWIEKQQHLPKIDDLKIAYFLHSCYYKLEPTKICIEKFYSIKSRCPEVFKNRRSEEVKSSYEITIQYVLPFKTPEGYSILFVKLIDADANKYNFINHLKAVDQTIILHFHRKGTSKGEVMVVDAEGMNFQHILKLHLGILHKYLYYLQESLHVRIKGVHVLGANPIVYRLLNMVKPFLRGDIFELFFIHKNLEELNETIPVETLPRDYGGNSPSLSEIQTESLRLVREFDAFFEREESEVSDESKRVERAEGNLESLFGSEGSFKSLSID